MGSSVALHVIGNEARDQVVKGNKKFLKIQHFLELMLCALEAQTVIKTFCL